jgi:hypothetical protein
MGFEQDGEQSIRALAAPTYTADQNFLKSTVTFLRLSRLSPPSGPVG